MTRDTCLSKRNKTSFYSLCSKKPSSPEQLCNVFLNNLLVPIYTPEGGGNGENSVFNVLHAQFPPKRPPLKVSTVIFKPKSEIARVSSTRKLSKYSLLREKVLKLPYVSRLLPLHQWIKSNGNFYFQAVHYHPEGHYHCHHDSQDVDPRVPCCVFRDRRHCRLCRYF